MRSLKLTVLRNTVWGSLGSVVEFVVPTIVGILVARAMGPAKLGAWGYVLWVAGMARVLGDLGVALAVRKYMGEFFGLKQYSIALSVGRIGVVFQAVVGLLLTAAGLWWTTTVLPPEQRVFASIAIISIFPAALMGTAAGFNDAMERMQSNVIPSMASVLVQATLSLGALLFGWGLEGLAVALLVGRTLDASMRWWFVRQSLSEYLKQEGVDREVLGRGGGISPRLRHDLVMFCLNATVLTVLRMVVWMRSEVFFLERLCTLEQLAFFSIAVGFSELPMQLALPFTRAAGASLYVERSRSADGGTTFAETFWRYQALVVLPASAGLCVLSGPLVRVLYGPQYFAAAPALFWALALGVAAPLARPTINLVTARGGQKYLVRWNLVAAVVVIGLDIVLVQHYCALGGAIAMGVGRTITTVGIWVIAARWFGFSLPLRYGSRLVASTLGMAATVWLATELCQDWLALVIGPPAGMLSFVVALRLARPLEVSDVERLAVAETVLPRALRSTYRALLDWLAPRPS